MNKTSPKVVITLLAICTGWFALASAIRAENLDTTSARPTGRIIVSYEQTARKLPPVALPQFYKKRQSLRAEMKLVRELGDSVELLAPAQALSHDEVRFRADQLSRQPGITSASPEYWRQPMLSPNDPLYLPGSADDQTYLYDGIYSLQAPAGWDISVGSSTVVIAVIDTGVLLSHPELSDRSVEAIGYDFVSADAPGDFTSANDGDGRDNDPTDPGDRCGAQGAPSSWHGTGVASVAAASSNDGIGMAGIDWSARLLHVRALGECGGTDADIIDALRWSAGLDVAGVAQNPTPASVINVSLGGETECTTAWQQAIDDVTATGVAIVMAAGNANKNALRNSPSNCSNVISVGSSTPGGSLDAGFSNFGLKVAIAAPGRDIVIATNEGRDAASADGNRYTGETGTSFSAALVSGVIGLIKSIDPDLNSQQIVTILQQSATSFAIGDCDDYYCGGGIANMANALNLATRFDGTSDNTELAQLTAAVQPLPVNSSTTATLGGYRDMQYFQLDIDRPGFFSITSDAEINLFGYLLDSQLSTLAIDENSGPDINFMLSAQLARGTYYVAVERRLHSARLDSSTEFTLLAAQLSGGSGGGCTLSVGKQPFDPLLPLLAGLALLGVIRHKHCAKSAG